MKRHIRCTACGRQRKKGHEKRAGTDKAYSPDCITYEQWKQNNK